VSRKKKILAGCAAALVIIAGSGVIHHLRVKGAVIRYTAELQAQGERLTVAESLPPTVPAASNSAAAFLSLTTNFVYEGPFATNGGSSMIMIAPGRAMAGWAQPWFGDGTIGIFSNTWREAFADLLSHESELNCLTGIAARPALQFDTDYTNGWFESGSLMLHLPGFKQAARLLDAAAQCELRRGDVAMASRYVGAELAITQGTTEDRWLITQLIRMATAHLSSESTWGLLQSRNVTEAELQALQHRWSSLEFLEAMERSLEMERAMGINAFQRTRTSGVDFERMAGHLFSVQLPVGQSEEETGFLRTRKAWARLKFHLAGFIWHYWSSYSSELEFLKQSQDILEQCRAMAADGNGLRARSIHEEFVSDNRIREPDGVWGVTGFKGLRALFSAPGTNVLEKALRVETVRQLTLTAIALQRYQLMHGTHPERLKDLQPEFLKELPIDPMDGEALRYRRLDEGRFVLYSVGDDRRDDGGDPDWTDEGAGRAYPPSGYRQVRDWVWPQPGSEEQVLAYWKKEVAENYTRLFLPEGEDDPYGGVPYEDLEPMINPETGNPVTRPDSGRVMLAPDGERAGKERQARIERLAGQWTKQYFQTLTNGGVSR